MELAARFRSMFWPLQDESYYAAHLGWGALGSDDDETLYFVVIRQYSRAAGSMRGEVMKVVEAEASMAERRESPDWQELRTPFSPDEIDEQMKLVGKHRDEMTEPGG